MRWFFDFLRSSIGKKIQMALTGLLLCGFLVAHLGGNFFLYKGPEVFNHYAEALEHNPLLPIAEIGLLTLFLLHIAAALRVSLENRKARPVVYEKTACAGGKTLSSITMIFSGLFLSAFLVIHVKSFRFSEHGEDLYGAVIAHLQNKRYALFYVAAMGALLLHLNHGFSSAFQTMGVNHSKYTPVIRLGGRMFAAAIALGFASIALWIGFIK